MLVMKTIGPRPAVLMTVVVLLLLSSVLSAQEASDNIADAQQLLALCKLSFARGDIDESIRYAKQATELDSLNSEYHYWLGIGYSEKTTSGWFWKKLSNAKKCKGAFEKSVELAPTSIAARGCLIEFHMRAPSVAGGSKDEARHQALEIAKLNSMSGHVAMAYIHQQEERFDEAEAELRQALEINPRNVQPYLQLGSLYYTQEEFQKAESTFVQGAENNPDDVSAAYNPGWFYQNQNQHEKACKIFENIIENYPDNLNARFFLASSYLDRKEISQADEQLAAIRTAQPDYSGINFLLGKKILFTGNNPEEGIGYLEKYLDDIPEEAYYPCWTNGHILPEIESFAPAWALAHMLTGMLQEALGDESKAKKEYELALELDPYSLNAQMALDKLKGQN